MSKKEEKQKYGDIIYDHELVKRTLMVAAFPALVSVDKDTKLYKGFLPGFEFAEISDVETEEECVETLQDMLDDEVEELVVFGKSLPDVEDDDKLLQKNSGYKIVYLDINVYCTPEELEYYDNCNHDCSCCSGHCHDDDCDEECGCEDERCDCEDEDCDCDENCDCEDEACLKDDCCCGEHHHHENCSCHEDKHQKSNCKRQGNKKKN